MPPDYKPGYFYVFVFGERPRFFGAVAITVFFGADFFFAFRFVTGLVVGVVRGLRAGFGFGSGSGKGSLVELYSFSASNGRK